MMSKVEELLRRAHSLREDMENRYSAEFGQRLREELHRAERYKHSMSLLVICDGASQLANLCGRLSRLMRRTDIVGLTAAFREGKEKEATEPERVLAAVLPETDEEGARTAAERFTRHLLNMHEVRLGIACYPGDGTDPEKLLSVAHSRA
jgi:hypothetical protein